MVRPEVQFSLLTYSNPGQQPCSPQWVQYVEEKLQTADSEGRSRPGIIRVALSRRVQTGNSGWSRCPFPGIWSMVHLH